MLKEFVCTYIEPSGSEKKIVVSASDSKEAIRELKKQGFLVTDVKEKVKKEISFTLRKNITNDDLYNIANQLNILLRSGIKIDKALNLLISTITKQKLKEVLAAVNNEIKQGQSVSTALENNKLFPPVFISMVYVGESIGDLSTAFDNIAKYLKFQIELKKEIISSLTYPLFLILASFATLIFMFNFIIPKFFAIFETSGKIPFTAKILFFISSAFDIKNLFISSLIFFGLILLKKYKFINFDARKFSVFIFQIPFIRNVVFYLELSRFSYSMHSMLKGGVEFIKAVKLSAEIIQDGPLRDSLLASINEIKKGRRISEVFSRITVLPDIFVNLVTVGEESGNLEEVFFELYQIFNEKFRNIIKKFITLLEPTIIVFMGLIVGFIIISLILTVMNVETIKL